MVRALYYGTMGGLQVPGDKAVARIGSRAALALATFVAASGYLLMSLPFGFIGLCAGLVVAGIGSSIQHPRASLLVTHTYGAASRGPLGIYNFAGDLGKAIFPAVVALLLPVIAWRPVVGMMAGIGMAVAAALLALLPKQPLIAAAEPKTVTRSHSRGGFWLLLTIGALDTATRMGYLLFLPFPPPHARRRGRGDRSWPGPPVYRRGSRQGRLRLARPASERGVERGRHRSRHSAADGRNPAAATRTDAPGPASARHRSQRHVVCAVWHRARSGAEG